MKNRYLILSIAILTVLLTGFVLASDLSLSVEPLSRADNVSTLTITNNNATQSYSVSIQTPLNITDSSGNVIQITPSSTQVTVANQTSEQINLSITSYPSDFDLGSFSAIVLASVVGNSSNNATTTLSVTESFCRYGNVDNDLEIIRVKDISSDNDWKWKPLDVVELEVKVKNTGSEDKDVVIELALYDPTNNEFIDLDSDKIEDTISINEDESQIVKFELEVPIEDIEDRTYRLYAKAYEEDDEDKLCVDKVDNWDEEYFREVEIDKKSREVILRKIVFEDTVSCGETTEISMKASNIGKHDEDRAYVKLYNKDLGINLKSDYFSLDEGDSKTVYFNIAVPNNATEKQYTLQLNTYYDYQKSDDEYDETSDNYPQVIRVEGNCQKPVTSDVQVTASLESEEAKAGQEIVIKTTLTNTGSETTTYSVFVTGNEKWSVLKEIDPSTITIQEGQSQDVSITLIANKDAEGENTLTLKVIYDGEIEEQPVSIAIESGKLGFGSFSENLKSNWLIWVIVLINIVLILAIILVAVKLSR